MVWNISQKKKSTQQNLKFNSFDLEITFLIDRGQGLKHFPVMFLARVVLWGLKTLMLFRIGLLWYFRTYGPLNLCIFLPFYIYLDNHIRYRFRF